MINFNFDARLNGSLANFVPKSPKEDFATAVFG